METGTKILETAKRAGARAYCQLMGIRESVFLENLDAALNAPQYPDAGELWACDTLEELRAHVQEKTGGHPMTFRQQAQAAYLNAVSDAMGIPNAAPARAQSHRARQPVAATR